MAEGDGLGFSRDLAMPETKVSLEASLASDNVATIFEREGEDVFLDALGRCVLQEYDRDESSRDKWSERMAKAREAALQVVARKTWPWEGAANVAFPLVAISAIQYHARAYPAIISDPIVRYQVFGEDADGRKSALGNIIAQHMNWQLTEQDEGWEDETDRLLIVQPIMGCCFRKVYFDSDRGYTVSNLVMPDDLVVPYYTKSLESSPRITHRLSYSRNDIWERVQGGKWLDLDYGRAASFTGRTTQLDQSRQKTQRTSGETDDESRPFHFLEQHRFLDLDGDGYAEPYIVVVEQQTGRVARIVRRFDRDTVQMRTADAVKCIEADRYFVKYPFIPSPDGGFYDMGLGSLLYPINAAISTMLNQLIDAGTLANLGGGFFGRGIKTRRGQKPVQAGQWIQTDSTGDDLRKSIMPLPAPQPSSVLLDCVKLLIEYGERLASATDEIIGKTPGQNTPAETSRNALAQAQAVLNGIHKRTWRSAKQEFRLRYANNARYMSDDPRDNPFGITGEKYGMDPRGVRPAADPSVQNENSSLGRLAALETSPTAWAYDPMEIARRRVEYVREPSPERLMKKDAQPPPNPKVMAEQTRAEGVKGKNQKVMADIKLAIQKAQREDRESQAKIEQMLADAAKSISEAKGVNTGHLIAALDLAIAENKHRDEMSVKALDQLMQMIDMNQQSAGEEGAAKPGGPPNGGDMGAMAIAGGQPGAAGGDAGAGAGAPGGMAAGGVPGA